MIQGKLGGLVPPLGGDIGEATDIICKDGTLPGEALLAADDDVDVSRVLFEPDTPVASRAQRRDVGAARPGAPRRFALHAVRRIGDDDDRREAGRETREVEDLLGVAEDDEVSAQHPESAGP